MKKSIVFLLVAALLGGSVYSQGFYFRAGGTYGLPVGTSVLGDKSNFTYDYSTDVSTATGSSKAVSGSFGAGPTFSIAVGYKFNQNFMFDLSGEYLVSNKYQISSYSKYIYSGYSAVDSDFTNSQAKAFLINPSFVFSAGFGKAAPYGRFGIVVGIPQMTVNESYYNNGDGVTQYDKTWVYKKGLAFGYQAAIGMNWKLSDKFDIYTEVNILNMTWYAQQSELTKDIENGTNVLPNMSVSQIQTKYEKSFDPTVQQDPTQPSVQLREASPFSSVSVNVGLRYTLFQKKDQ
ncbi:MAG: outer membrane beta-barrel protein [Bacteroidales bacterium]|jgi:hypothetical protein